MQSEDISATGILTETNDNENLLRAQCNPSHHRPFACSEMLSNTSIITLTFVINE